MAPFGGLAVNLLLIVMGLIFGATGLFLLGTAVSTGYRGVQIQLSDVSPIADIHSNTDGPIAVEGVVQHADDLDTITAPLSGEECSAWEIARLKRKVDTDSRREKYKTELRAKQARPFVLRDDSGGMVEVNPENASVSLSDDSCYSVERGDDIGDDARRRIQSLSADATRLTGRQSEDDMEPADLLSQANPKYEEYVLTPGDDVHVYGATAQAPTNRSRLAELTGDDFYTITEADESVTVKKKLLGALIVGVIGLFVALVFGVFPAYGGLSNLLGGL